MEDGHRLSRTADAVLVFIADLMDLIVLLKERGGGGGYAHLAFPRLPFVNPQMLSHGCLTCIGSVHKMIHSHLHLVNNEEERTTP